MTAKPALLPINESVIDAVFPKVRRFVIWSLEFFEDRWNKVPYRPTEPNRRASSTDAATWGTLDEALAAVLDGKADGLGFVLGDGFVGYDRDDCRDPITGALTDEAREDLAALNSYAELSPSGTGLHIIGRGGPLPPGRRRGGFELYDAGRYFTVTGQHVAGTPLTIASRPNELTALTISLLGGDVRGTENIGDADIRWTMPAVIHKGHRHDELFRLLRSQKARNISFEAALACCLVENRLKCRPPLAESVLRPFLNRAWRLADRPGFGVATLSLDPSEVAYE